MFLRRPVVFLIPFSQYGVINYMLFPGNNISTDVPSGNYSTGRNNYIYF